MDCAPCTYSQDTEVDCLPTGSSGTAQLSLLSGMDMPAKSCESAQPKDGSPACTCGTAMSDCSIHPHTPEAWIASMRDSIARTLAWLENRQAYLREPAQVFTAKSCASLAWFDQSSFSWKTSQRSLVTGWAQFSETWPRWGTTVAGCAFVHPMSERRITETDGLLWPTPLASDGTGGGLREPDGKRGPRVKDVILGNGIWPTPATRDYKGARTPRAMQKTGRNPATNSLPDALGAHSGLSVNPNWVEWLMGFPIGFTDSKDLVMPRSRSKQPQRGSCSAESKQEGKQCEK